VIQFQIADGKYYATSKELWDWKSETWSRALQELRRLKTPAVYSDLVARATEKSEASHSTPRGSISAQTSLVSNEGAKYSIFGNIPCKGHQIPKSKTCRPFYGPVAEIATGLNLSGDNDADRQKKWSKLLRGGQTLDGHGFVGLEKRAENFVVVHTYHQDIYDTLENGVLAIIPICSAEFSRGWQQGGNYNLLVVADTSETYRLINISRGTVSSTFHHEASCEDITEATKFLGICIKALAEILASDSNMLLDPMEEFLKACHDEEHKAESNELRKIMRDKLEVLQSLRTSLSGSGEVEVPTVKPNIAGKVVLKIDMKKYMEISGVNKMDSSVYPYPDPDPWLVGMKAAINIYFGHKKVMLHPACQPPSHDDDSDEDSDDEDCWYLAAVHGSSPCATGAAQHISIQEEDFFLPVQDISFVSDDDDETSVITDDGEYRAPLTTEE
jgi:hypothetical protein